MYFLDMHEIKKLTIHMRVRKTKNTAQCLSVPGPVESAARGLNI